MYLPPYQAPPLPKPTFHEPLELVSVDDQWLPNE